MAIEFREDYGCTMVYEDRCTVVACIHKLENGQVIMNETLTIEHVEQILSKMKELQGEVTK